MTITPLDPADAAAMDQWYDLEVAVGAHDLPDVPAPSRQEHLARLDHPWPNMPESVLLAWTGDRVVGAASCVLPQAEDRTMVALELVVHPLSRRRGIGTALLQAVYAFARSRQRTTLEIETVRALPGGPPRDDSGSRYLVARDHRPGLISIRSRCVVADQQTADEALLTEAWTHADGYSIVQWRGAMPDDIIEDMAALQSRLVLDAPSGDLAVEQKVWDTARIRAQETTERARGYRSYSTAARHDASGRIVARTKISIEGDDDSYGRQRITIVEPAHRGRRLGLIVKASNHAYARAQEPRLRVIDTWNAEDNGPMRAVNAALGFEPVDAWAVFQIPVPDA